MIINIKRIFKTDLFKNTGIYTFFNLIDKIIPFLLLPFITRALSVEGYGIYVLFQSLVGFLLPFVTLNTDASILINYFKVDKKKFPSYLSNGILVLIINFIIITILFFILEGWLSGLIDFPRNWLIAVLIICPMQYFTNLNKNIWQIKKQPFKYGVYSVSLTLFKNLLMLLFILGLGYNWEGLIISQLIGWGVFSFISLVIMNYQNYFTLEISKEFIVDNIKVGTPISLHKLGGWLGDLSSRLIIASVIGSAAVATYGIAAVFGMIVIMVQDAFNKAFVPFLFEKLDNIDNLNRIKLVRLTYLYNLFILIFGTFVGFVGYYGVELLFGNAYSSSKDYIMWLTVAYAFNGMYKTHVNYIFYSKKTYLLLYITLSTGFINVILSYILVSTYGPIGAAQSLLFVFISTYILAWYVGNRVISMPWFSKNIFIN